MAPDIQVLPVEVVHLIAAGEVIDSLAAVVRELAENALDAGANRITVSLWTQQWRVCVADNGEGMPLADLQQAAMPHSTSKIRGGSDLWRIHSLGFRGEALHSLAQLADLEICSRWVGTSEGWRIRYSSQGKPLHAKTVAIAPGTVVTVSNLFADWLPRRQGLPSPAQQLRAVQLTIQQLALCHPHITWQVEQNDRPWFAIWAGASAKQILPQLLREVQPSDLQELKLGSGGAEEHRSRDDRNLEPSLEKQAAPGQQDPPAYSTASSQRSSPGSQLYLIIGLPDRCHRHRPDWVKIAVNGRVVKLPELEQTVFAAFRRTLPRDRHPVCFLHLQISPEQIDWNRHPAKAEVYLHHLPDWQERVSEAIAQALQLNSATLSESAHAKRIGQLLKAAEAQGTYGAGKQSGEDVEADTLLSAHTPAPLNPLKAIAQVHGLYILAEYPSGMWLIEQHIAHERILYEQLCDRWQLVPLEPPVILSHLSIRQQEQLQRIGLEVEPFGEQLWAIRTAPESLAQREDCADALLELSLGGDLDSALVATACRTAIRNGTPLSLQEMQALLDQWQQTRNPRTCPHGRPIYLRLEESSLSSFFRRHWVIGKSHGI
jgi:DNA mismatch repair protein MutL